MPESKGKRKIKCDGVNGYESPWGDLVLTIPASRSRDINSQSDKLDAATGARQSERDKLGNKPQADTFIPLTSWNDIFAALNEPHGTPVWKSTAGNRDKIRNLNEQHNGPIIFTEGKGNQPTVAKAALMTWWGGLSDHFDARIDEQKAEAESTEFAVGDSHNYGATGTVVPGISGSVKAKRTTGKKGKERKR